MSGHMDVQLEAPVHRIGEARDHGGTPLECSAD